MTGGALFEAACGEGNVWRSQHLPFLLGDMIHQSMWVVCDIALPTLLEFWKNKSRTLKSQVDARIQDLTHLQRFPSMATLQNSWFIREKSIYKWMITRNIPHFSGNRRWLPQGSQSAAVFTLVSSAMGAGCLSFFGSQGLVLKTSVGNGGCWDDG